MTSAPWLMVGASLLFATMGVCVKLASSQYSAGEIVLYRALVGAVVMLLVTRLRGVSLRTTVPGMHFGRSATGVLALCLWFYAISGLPLATAMTLNYMSSVWIALFLIGGAVMFGAPRVDGRLVAAALAGFAGVALVLRPTIDQQQLWFGLAGMLSGLLSSLAYLQVTALGRAGEPETRIVFYFSVGGVLAGAGLTALMGGLHAHSWRGAALLLATGVLATAAQMMMTRAYGTGRMLTIASLQYLGIAFSFVYGVVLFDDAVTGSALLGMLLIVGAGVAATALKARQVPDDPPHAANEP